MAAVRALDVMTSCFFWKPEKEATKQHLLFLGINSLLIPGYKITVCGL